MSARVNMLSWEPPELELTSQPVAGVEDIAQRATELLKSYQAHYKGEDATFPGLTLQPEAKEWGSLVIAVAPIGWALIHNSEDYLTQHCTETVGAAEGRSFDVIWDQEPTSIPRRYFVTEEQARSGLEQWLEDGTLTRRLKWSDDCS